MSGVMPRQGVFITLEGGEGAGKSTAAGALAAMFQAEGADVLLTREPGGTAAAEAIRGLLLGDTALDPLAQTLLHFAARADHVAMKIRPALAAGAIVICDRYYDSTMAYQAYGQNVDIAAVAGLIRMIGLIPDITFMLNVPEVVSRARLVARNRPTDRYERMDGETMARIAAGFTAIAAAEPARCVVLDGTARTEAMVAQMRGIITARTGR
ncbi:MAG: dTMP kinase [Acidocella sp.]|nr:dTMP kinase [Acidocella sp.]